MHSRQVSTRGHIEAGMSLELFIGSPRQEMSSHFTPEIYDMHSEPCRGQQEWPFGNGMPRPCGDPRVQDLERFFFFFSTIHRWWSRRNTHVQVFLGFAGRSRGCAPKSSHNFDTGAHSRVTILHLEPSREQHVWLFGSDVLGPRSKHGIRVLEFASFNAQTEVFIRVYAQAGRPWMFFFISIHHSTSQRVSLLFSSELFALRHLSGGTMCISIKVENSKVWLTGSGEPRLRSEQPRL